MLLGRAAQIGSFLSRSPSGIYYQGLKVSEGKVQIALTTFKSYLRRA